jgi:hypothetical protein
MKKKFVFILAAQTVLILLTLTYAFVQQGIAKEYAILAENNAVKAVEQAKLANEHAVKCKELMIELQKCKK